MAAQEYAMYPDQVREKLAGKSILIIGASKCGHRHVWDIFSNLKIQITIVSHETTNCGASTVDKFICYDYVTDRLDIEKHASNIVQLLGDRVGDIDGCFTFTEPDTPMTAAICQKLGLRGFHPHAAVTVRSKQNTYEALRSETSTNIYQTSKYSPISYRIQKEEDIKEAKQIKYPAILKPENDASSWGVVEVISEEDCMQQYNRIQNSFGTSNYGGSFGKSMVLMEFLEGLSYNVDLVIYGGELMAAFITDIGLYVPDMFNDTTTCQPTNLSEELRDQLITAAHQCCCKVGLLNGVFNTEFKMTKCGFKVIEINGRTGCYRRCIVYKNTHGVLLWEIAAAIACGIKPYFPEVPARCFAVGAYLFIKFHGEQFLKESVNFKLRSLAEANDILLDMRTETVDLGCLEEFPIPFCHIVALNKTSIKQARQTLVQICQDLGFSRADYDIERFTSVWA
ncbi:carnosine synthase 1-like [Pecten maximus]|uniref:carnosine synthase 1-like n=1 Tax=Pecten maximus TaxID=6579 RepID=UPI0014589A31|nr:carnosine synthase 1-like [Pecten maximus]